MKKLSSFVAIFAAFLFSFSVAVAQDTPEEKDSITVVNDAVDAKNPKLCWTLLSLSSSEEKKARESLRASDKLSAPEDRDELVEVLKEAAQAATNSSKAKSYLKQACAYDEKADKSLLGRIRDALNRESSSMVDTISSSMVQMREFMAEQGTGEDQPDLEVTLLRSIAEGKSEVLSAGEGFGGF